MSLGKILRLLGAGCLLVTCSTNLTFAAKKYTVMVVLTHGDDNMAIAPLLAKYAAEGHAVHDAVFTGLQDLCGRAGFSKARGGVRPARSACGRPSSHATPPAGSNRLSRRRAGEIKQQQERWLRPEAMLTTA